MTDMRNVLILYLYSNFLVKSQIIADSIVPRIIVIMMVPFLDVLSVSQIGNWFYNDDLLGWVIVSTINDIQLSVNSDT